MKRFVLKTLVLAITIILLLWTNWLYAQNKQRLRRPAAEVDAACALLWKAIPGLYWTTMNYGRLFNGWAETDVYWPHRTHTTAGQHASSSGIVFAVEDNVIESHTDYDNPDWMAKDGSLYTYHTDKWLISGSKGSYYATAFSDAPGGFRGTWPDRPKGSGKLWWPGRLPPGFTDEDRYDTTAPWALAERETWFVFNDKYNIGKPSLGIEIEEQIYNFARTYAADFDFLDLLIRNTSDKEIKGAYFGYYLYFKDDIGGFNDDYLVAYDSDWDEESENPDVFYLYDPFRSAYDEKLYTPALVGIAMLKTPRDMGVTDFHFFIPPGPSTDEGMWPIISSNPDDPDLPGSPELYFHGSNPRIDDTDWIPQNKPDGAYWAFFVMTGPFDMAPGDTVWSSFALVAGGDEADFKKNVQMAQEMARNDYRGPSAPPEPTLYAVPGDRKITLYWDTAAEQAEDFEGYKLYKAYSTGLLLLDWGTEIVNTAGDVVGYVPLAQWDKIDGITGPDPLNSYQYLGKDTGLRHTYVDTNVINGVGYTYVLTSYSTGDPANDLPSMESGKGRGRQQAGATPFPGATGTIPGSVEGDTVRINPEDDFYITVDVLDQRVVTGHTYELSFSDWTVIGRDSAYTQGFNLYDVDTGQFLLQDYPLTDASGDNTPVIDGIRVNLKGRLVTGEVEEVWNATSTVADGAKWPYWEPTLYAAAKGLDFEFVVDTQNPVTLAAFRGFGTATYQVPIRVRNVKTGEDLSQYMQVGDWAARFPGNPLYGGSPGQWDLEPGGACWNPAVDSTNSKSRSDFLVGFDAQGKQLFLLYTTHPPDAQAPSDGDRFFVGVRKPFPRDAVYTFKTRAPYVDKRRIDLSKVRVVPNPYIIREVWDQPRINKIMFVNLPEICDIYIFTVAGDLVRHIEHRRDYRKPSNPDLPGPWYTHTRVGLGFHEWELVSDKEIDVAYGIYIYVVTTPDGKKTVGKFAVIR